MPMCASMSLSSGNSGTVPLPWVFFVEEHGLSGVETFGLSVLREFLRLLPFFNTGAILPKRVKEMVDAKNLFDFIVFVSVDISAPEGFVAAGFKSRCDTAANALDEIFARYGRKIRIDLSSFAFEVAAHPSDMSGGSLRLVAVGTLAGDVLIETGYHLVGHGASHHGGAYHALFFFAQCVVDGASNAPPFSCWPPYSTQPWSSPSWPSCEPGIADVGKAC